MAMVAIRIKDLVDTMEVVATIVVDATMAAATMEMPLSNSIKEGGYYGLCF